MSSDRIIEILLALLAAAVGVGTFYLATRATKEQGRAAAAAVDAGAYQRAREIYESAISSMEDQLGRLRSDLNNLDVEVTKLRESNRLLSAEVNELRGANERLISELRTFGA